MHAPFQPESRILNGDCRALLATLRENCINCVVTSPPYWGLRDYGLPPSIWGGDSNCAHDWQEQRWYTEQSAAKSDGCAEAFSEPGEANAQRLKDARWRTASTCNRCGAWRGSFGLEPTYQMYVDHSVEIFRAVRRALRDDGMFWLNLGDSYSGSGRGGNPKDSPHKKQRTNIGSMSVVGNTARTAAVTKFSGNARVPVTLKAKDLVGIPWRVAFALQQDGWYLRDAIIWAKPNGMPGSQQDRCTPSYETIFQFSKSATYWSDFDAIKTPPKESTRVRLAQDVQAQAGSHRANAGAKTNGPMKAVGARSDKQRGHGRVRAGFNERWDAMEKSEQQAKPATMRNVWFVSPKGFKEAHFAVMPEEVARRCVLAGSPPGGFVLDPFAGAGTTGVIARQLGCHFLGFELNPEYVAMAEKRIAAVDLAC